MKPRTPIRPLIIREKSYTLHLVSALAILLLAMTLDYREQAMEAQQIAAASEARMLDCMNGEARWKAEDGSMAGCPGAETN